MIDVVIEKKRRILRDSRPTQYRLAESHRTDIGMVRSELKQLHFDVKQIVNRQTAMGMQLGYVNIVSTQIQELYAMVAKVTQEILDKVNAQTSRLDGMVQVVQALKDAAANPDDSAALASLRTILGELTESDVAIQRLDDALKAGTRPASAGSTG